MCRYILKDIHVHLDLRKVFTTLIWNDQQSFNFTICMLLSLPFFLVYVKYQFIY